MQKYWQFLITITIVTCLTFIIHPWLHFTEQITGEKTQISWEKVMAQEMSESEEKDSANVQEQVAPDNDKLATPVVVDGETLFYIKTSVEDLSPSERAERQIKRIKDVAEDYSENVDLIKANKIADDVFMIMSEQRPLIILTQADAEAANQPLEQLSSEYANKIKAAIAKYRQQRRFINLLRSAIYTIISLAAFILVIRIINWVHQFNDRFLTSWLNRLQSDNQTRSGVWQWLQIIGLDFYRIFYSIHKLIYWGVILAVIYLFIPLILSFFPLTQKLSDRIVDGLTQVIITGWNNFLDYLPNLFIIIFTVVVIYYLNKSCRQFFLAVENETISLPGFYPDWAKPTYKLSVFLIIAFAIALIYPYLPGSDTASFHGISIFVGALVTIGGAGALGNIVGGFIIIYTRAYQIGDRIKIDDIKGDVVEKTVFSTRICTIDNEVVTIPNSTIIGSNIINYSATRRDFKKPLLHCTCPECFRGVLNRSVSCPKVYRYMLLTDN